MLITQRLRVQIPPPLSTPMTSSSVQLTVAASMPRAGIA